MALRQVATRCAIGTAVVGTGTNRYFVRTIHDVLDNKPIKIVDVNRYISGNISVNGPGIITERGLVEYPINSGTFYTFLWSGSPTNTIASGGITTSDALTIPGLAAGTQIAVHRDLQSTSGVPYGSGQNSHSPASGDAVEINPANTNLARPLVNVQPSWSMFPAAILSDDSLIESAALIGDSRCAEAISAQTLDGRLYRGEIANVIRATAPYINLAVSGDTAQSFLASNDFRRTLAGYCSYTICEYPVNDIVIVLSRTALQAEADVQAIQALWSGKPFYTVTLPPVSGSSDSYTTLIGQTTNSRNSERVIWNTRRRANLGGFTGYIELAACTEAAPLDGGKWQVNGTPFYLVSDGTHEGSIGNDRYANAVITPPLPFYVAGGARRIGANGRALKNNSGRMLGHNL